MNLTSLLALSKRIIARIPWLGRWFVTNRPSRFQGLSSEQFAAALEQGLFDAAFYAEQLAPNAHRFGTAVEAFSHYVSRGAALGLNPSSKFNTQFYLSDNPDVAKRGINPLVHYIKFGAAEGRLTQPDVILNLFSSLWGGQSEAALDALASLQGDSSQRHEVRARAAWEQARWYSHVGDHERALQLALQILEYDPAWRLHKGRLLLVANSAVQGAGCKASALDLLKEYLAQSPDDYDVMLFAANLCEQQLETVNCIFAKEQLSTVFLRDERGPLSLLNIDAKPLDDESGPKVSVIVPMYNAEHTVLAALESLVCQSWRNLEILVVDDKSQDSSFDLVTAFAAEHPQVRLLQMEQNSGSYACRNFALGFVTGHFVTTHDADDWSHPDKIRCQMQALNDSSSAMGVMTDWVRCSANFTFTQNWRPSETVIHESHSSFLCRKEVFERLKGWDEVRVSGDTEFIWRMQAAFGTDSLIAARKGVPLAFALDDDSSLTRHKFTHVRTVNFGLRYLYRESCMYWHSQASNLALSKSADNRPFYAPKLMLRHATPHDTYDYLVVADFACEHEQRGLYELIAALNAGGFKTALLHWPLFARRKQRLQGQFFDCIARGHGEPVVYGDTIQAHHIVVPNCLPVATDVDQVPSVSGVKRVTLCAGEYAGKARVNIVRRLASNVSEDSIRVVENCYPTMESLKLMHNGSEI
ncbi:MAG: glycosyltransferase family 2 protein [Firmicutes bacterium]|nr:glycosyltransferase family 2 protein [Bacillota bacterium]